MAKLVDTFTACIVHSPKTPIRIQTEGWESAKQRYGNVVGRYTKT